nr:MAG TPA: hypothetical protein [Caudoviricetes sp.]
MAFIYLTSNLYFYQVTIYACFDFRHRKYNNG